MRLSSRPSLFAICGFAAVVLFAFTAQAQVRAAQAEPKANGPYPFGLAEGRLMIELAEDLGISKTTLDAIKELAAEQKNKEAKGAKEHMAAWVKMNDLLDKASPSEEDLLAASAELATLISATRGLKLSYTLKVRALLTDDQLKNYMVRRKYVPIPRRK
jgi:hypothetical protein